jgi:hypothetical protein
VYFPCVFDIKYLMKFCDNLHGGLNKVTTRGGGMVQQGTCGGKAGACRGKAHVGGREAAGRIEGHGVGTGGCGKHSAAADGNQLMRPRGRRQHPEAAVQGLELVRASSSGGEDLAQQHTTSEALHV